MHEVLEHNFHKEHEGGEKRLLRHFDNHANCEDCFTAVIGALVRAHRHIGPFTPQHVHVTVSVVRTHEVLEHNFFKEHEG